MGLAASRENFFIVNTYPFHVPEAEWRACFCTIARTIPLSTYLQGMARAEKRPEEGNLPNPGDHPASSHQTDDQADLQEKHQLQRPPPLHLLALLYLELHAACVSAYARARFTACDVTRIRERRNFRNTTRRLEKSKVPSYEDENTRARVTLRRTKYLETEKFGEHTKFLEEFYLAP